MPSKPCVNCSRPAEFSLAILLSTLQVRPRRQKCSKTILLYSACLHVAITSPDPQPFIDPHQTVITAYTAIAGDPTVCPDPDHPCCDPTEDHHGDKQGVSCRPCLIACNSRQNDELAESTSEPGA
jgi:hypothetical protein